MTGPVHRRGRRLADVRERRAPLLDRGVDRGEVIVGRAQACGASAAIYCLGQCHAAARGGGRALERARRADPAELVELVAASGLRASPGSSRCLRECEERYAAEREAGKNHFNYLGTNVKKAKA